MSKRLLNALVPGRVDENRLGVEAAAEVIRWREELTGLRWNLPVPGIPENMQRVRVIWRMPDLSEYEPPGQKWFFDVLDRVEESRTAAKG